MSQESTQIVTQIAVGILKQGDKFCLSLRQAHQSFADHWEFPGGKIEEGETIEHALVREFQEELAIETSNWQPLIEIPWQYGDKAICLNVYQTEQYSGEPKGNEGQQVKWFDYGGLKALRFPQANAGIISALGLPDEYMITGQFDTVEQAVDKLNKALSLGNRFCQLRAKDLPAEGFAMLAAQAIKCCHAKGAKILLNGSVDLLQQFPDADGIQLASNKIFEFDSRPIDKDKWLGVSTHTVEDIQQALKIDADFILLSPVKETNSHPGVEGLGWKAFADMVKNVPIPVYALGGMKPEDIAEAKKHGAQGIAAISGFWPK